MGTKGYLLDSHVLIWSLYQQHKLSAGHRQVLEGDTETWISIATIWEVEIKKQSGKLPLPDSIWNQALAVGHRFLAITAHHAVQAAGLPMHHGDPFDRMLIAHAIEEDLTILTVDRQFSAYGVALA